MLVLCIDEDFQTVTYLEMVLPDGFCLKVAKDFESLRSVLVEYQFDLIFLEIEFEMGRGLDLIPYLQRYQRGCPILIHTSSPILQDAVSCMVAGAIQYVQKLIARDQLIEILLHCRAMQENSDRVINLNPDEIDIILDGCVEHKTFQQLLAICKTGIIFLNGECGTGKNDIARRLSNEIRSNNKLYKGIGYKFVSYSGESRSSAMQSVDLFGTEFDSLPQKKSLPGLLKNDNRAFIFIEEITNIHKDIQQKIAQYMQVENNISNKCIKKPIIFSSIHKIDSEYFLNAVTPELKVWLLSNWVYIKPLRERNSNIVSLSWIYLRETLKAIPGLPATSFHPTVFEHLLQKKWPGNIPELRNYIINGVRNCKQSVVTIKDFQG